MPTITQPQIQASFLIDAVEYNCQIINAEYKPTSTASGETVDVACPDGSVINPGEHQDGSFNGEVFGDTTDQGVTMALAQAQHTDATVTYSFTFFTDLPSAQQLQYNGTAKVQDFTMTWEPGKQYHRHSITLVVLTDAGPERPTP